MTARWSTASVVLHWAAAALIVGLATAGFVMTELPADAGARQLLARLHTISGFALMALTLARLLVRRRGPTPAPLPVPAVHRRGIGVVHALIYVATFGLGASGAMTAARSAWPDYVHGDIAVAPALDALASRQAHELIVFALIGLIALHVIGVFVQQVRHGGALRRMVPFLE